MPISTKTSCGPYGAVTLPLTSKRPMTLVCTAHTVPAGARWTTRAPGVEQVAASAGQPEAGALGLEQVVDDERVLARAAEEGRLLVSHDYRTMPRHFATFVTTRTSAGVIMVSQAIPLSDVVADLLLIWEASEAEEWINRFDTFPL